MDDFDSDANNLSPKAPAPVADAVTANPSPPVDDTALGVAAAALATAAPSDPAGPAEPAPLQEPEATDNLTSTDTVNGHTVRADDDLNNEDNLSPPPDTPESAVPLNPLEDEIVVGTKATNGVLQSSPLRVTSDPEDVEMEDAGLQALPDVGQVPGPYPKRKRASLYSELDEDKMEKSIIGEEPEIPRPVKPKTHGLGAVKGVVLGYWRDSPVVNEKDKHAVIGFIDVRDRLRTRIQTTNRAGESIINLWPLPPGPGGSWVTFERVVFNKHLVNLDHNQVKEYVRIRTEAVNRNESEEEAGANDRTAVKEAIRRVQEHPPPETATTPAIAYGPEIPEHAILAHRPDAKKRRIDRSASTTLGVEGQQNRSPAAIAPAVQSIHRTPLDPMPGTRPTKILVGHWRGSSEERPEDKHAVFGILGANDMFRVKVTRETRDGRQVIGNFPTGAGALWIHYEEVEFDSHLKHLSRPEIKEYVRVRQWQIDQGEQLEQRIDNETKAVFMAQQRVTSSFKPDPESKSATSGFVAANSVGIVTADSDGDYNDIARTKREGTGHELRGTRQKYPEIKEGPRPGRHSLPDASELRAANRPASVDHVERANSIARREIARVEAVQQRADQRAASREASVTKDNTITTNGNGNSNKALFGENLQRLNKVWASQEASRLKSGTEDAKIYGGVKYERKQTGPFQGKLVSQGTIISIDGEDYVEYRVLTKPSFF